VQVFEVGTGTMMAAKGAVYPVYKLMADQGEPWDPSAFLAPVVGYYSDAEGNILSMPFNSSTPIMYFNKDVFAKAGLDPEVAPKTWKEVGEFAEKIVSSGAADLGWPRKLLRHPGPAVWHQAERLRWHGRRVHLQRPEAGRFLGPAEEVVG
jgi:sn-glycerol 3-phosphate transport system substrate-binding protein